MDANLLVSNIGLKTLAPDLANLHKVPTEKYLMYYSFKDLRSDYIKLKHWRNTLGFHAPACEVVYCNKLVFAYGNALDMIKDHF